MSSDKFASITAGLLARKGEARPWPALSADEAAVLPEWRTAPAASAAAVPTMGDWRASPAPHGPTLAPSLVPSPAPPLETKDKSCLLRLSPHDYERLGILAVKAGATRQQLLKAALTEYLAVRAAEYGCACLGACDNNCGRAG